MLYAPNPTADLVPALRICCGLGIAKPPPAKLKFRILRATGLMLDPSHATCTPPAKLAVFTTGLFWGQNAAPSAAADRLFVSCDGRLTVAEPSAATPFNWRVPW